MNHQSPYRKNHRIDKCDPIHLNYQNGAGRSTIDSLIGIKPAYFVFGTEKTSLLSQFITTEVIVLKRLSGVFLDHGPF